jgi:hypothetical protein
MLSTIPMRWRRHRTVSALKALVGHVGADHGLLTGQRQTITNSAVGGKRKIWASAEPGSVSR